MLLQRLLMVKWREVRWRKEELGVIKPGWLARFLRDMSWGLAQQICRVQSSDKNSLPRTRGNPWQAVIFVVSQFTCGSRR